MAGGLLNSVAGGGGFIAFPALLFTGVNAINANATNTVALWPGTLASVGAYWREFQDRSNWALLRPLFLVTFIGSVGGGPLLFHTPPRTLVPVITLLLRGATPLFFFGARSTAV